MNEACPRAPVLHATRVASYRHDAVQALQQIAAGVPMLLAKCLDTQHGSLVHTYACKASEINQIFCLDMQSAVLVGNRRESRLD